MRPVRTVLLFAAFLSAAVLATLPLVLRPSGTLPANADALLNAWVLRQVCAGLANPSDLLRGNMFYPDPAALLYSEPLIGVGLQSLPLCVLGLDHVTLFNASYWLVLAMCALGAWLLAKEITGSASAALVGAVVFTFTSANYDSAARLQIVASQWTPICLLYLIRFCRRGNVRDAALMGLAFAMQSLSCVYYEILLALLLILTVPWWVGLAGGLAQARARISGTVVAIVLTAILVLPLNLAQRTHLSPVLVARSLAQHLTLSDFTDVLPTNFLYGNWLGRSRVAYDALYFPGFVPIGLALLFFVWGARRRDWCLGYTGLKPVLVVGSIAFAFSFGAEIKTPWMDVPGPVAAFSGWMPGLAQVRVPSRFLMFSRLALAMVAACAVHRLLGRAPRVPTSLAALAIAAACFLEHWSPPLDVWAVPTRNEMPAVYSWLEQPEQGRGAIMEFPPALQRLRREEAVWLHTAAFHGLPMANGYSSFRPAWYEFVMEAALETPGRFVDILRRLGVRTVVVHPRPRGLTEVDGAVTAFLEYSDRHPEAIRLVRSFSDPRHFEGIWSRLGDERVFAIQPAAAVGVSNAGPAIDRAGWSCRSIEPGCEAAMDGDLTTLIRGHENQNAGGSLKVRFAKPTTIQAVSIGLGRFPQLFARDAAIRLLEGEDWVAVDAELDIEGFLSDTVRGSLNPVMMWKFPPTPAMGFEIRVRSGGQGFRELGIPEVNAHASP